MPYNTLHLPKAHHLAKRLTCGSAATLNSSEAFTKPYIQ